MNKKISKENLDRLKQLEKRIRGLEKVVFSKSFIIPTKKMDSLPDLILKLRNQDFFRQPKSVKEVHEKILPMYHCNLDRVDTALRRLNQRKQLRISNKIIKGKKVLAYVW